jgi:mRNA-degrading endonuclease HigB of HigAB toxin-antitoxin module
MSDPLLNQILSEIKDLKSNIATKSDVEQIKAELAAIKNSVERIEMNQPEDIKAMLQTISDKLDERDSEIQVLNRRVFKVESALERLSGQ